MWSGYRLRLRAAIHAELAAGAGADGLVLLTAGAGGQTGWLNPFAFVRAVRAFFDGVIVLAGGICDGIALRAAQVLGCDLAYMGTKFIATRESMADERYKQMLVDSNADDILLTTAFTGLQTNMLRPSIVAAGLDPDNLPPRGAIEIDKDIDIGAREARSKHWRDIWSAGPFWIHACRYATRRFSWRRQPFMVPIKGRENFKEAIRTKLIREVAGRTRERPVSPASDKEPRVSCTIGERLWQDRWGR